MSLFSIIVANYNNNQYLDDLIRSIYHQTFTNWELIIVDDCSEINPFNLLKPFLEKDNRIRFFRNEVNQGAGATFGKAAEKARGEIIGMLGADDALMPNAIEKMTEAHRHFPKASLINSEAYDCDERLQILGKNINFHEVGKDQHLINDISIGNFATFKKNAYLKTKGFNRNFRRAVDHDIYLKLEEVGELAYVHLPLYLYRRNPIGISQNTNGIRAAQFSIQAKLDAYERRKKMNAVYNLTRRQAIKLKKTWYSRELYTLRQSGKKKELKAMLRSSIAEIPSLLLKRSVIMHFLRLRFIK